MNMLFNVTAQLTGLAHIEPGGKDWTDPSHAYNIKVCCVVSGFDFFFSSSLIGLDRILLLVSGSGELFWGSRSGVAMLFGFFFFLFFLGSSFLLQACSFFFWESRPKGLLILKEKKRKLESITRYKNGLNPNL